MLAETGDDMTKMMKLIEQMGETIKQQEVKREKAEAEIRAQIEDIEESGIKEKSGGRASDTSQVEGGEEVNPGEIGKEMERLKNKVKAMEF